jgi:hypothetical protein
MSKKQYKMEMFKDYDRCLKNGRQKLCRNCSLAQRAKCEKRLG